MPISTSSCIGRYPIEERWRVNLVGIIFVAAAGAAAHSRRCPYKVLNAITVLRQCSRSWRSSCSLAAGFGLAVCRDAVLGRPAGHAGDVLRRHRRFACRWASCWRLGRRSKTACRQDAVRHLHRDDPRRPADNGSLHGERTCCRFSCRPAVTFDKLLRALIGVALFASAYMAEVIRGGLQAIPKGQYEGADSLGLGYWQKMRLIVLPQALKLVIPGHRQHLHRSCSRIRSLVSDHQHVRPARHRQHSTFPIPTGQAPSNADDWPRLRRLRLLDFLLRHVALFPVHGKRGLDTGHKR